MYGQPHGAFSYDQQLSPANTGSFSQAIPAHSPTAALASAQQSDNQSATGANAFGTGMSDFSRPQAAGQTSYHWTLLLPLMRPRALKP